MLADGQELAIEQKELYTRTHGYAQNVDHSTWCISRKDKTFVKA